MNINTPPKIIETNIFTTSGESRQLNPSPIDWSATFCFQTEASPIPPQPPQAAQVIPLWLWVIIAIGVVLDISLFVLLLHRWST